MRHTEYSCSVDIPGLTLTAGTTYWLGISNTTDGAVTWGWETTNETGGHARFLTGTGWTAQDADLAFFFISGVAVPEPASLAILGSSLLGFAVARHRKKAA